MMDGKRDWLKLPGGEDGMPVRRSGRHQRVSRRGIGEWVRVASVVAQHGAAPPMSHGSGRIDSTPVGGAPCASTR